MQGFGYDATGNRTSATRAGTSTSYTYVPGTHRLQSVGTAARDYDAAGNTTAIAPHTLSYDERGRLSEVRENGVLKMRYRYNGRGERVAKLHPSDASRNRWFVYADDGRLLGEYDNDGERIAEYVWLDDTLIAVLSEHDGSGYQFVETDHLGTPRVIIHPRSSVIIWRWNLSATAFGEHVVNSVTDDDQTGYVSNLRYPGQYFDAETGLHYNYFRDYDPSAGRYVESDPIGLLGGISTYGYVFQSPLLGIDKDGLAANYGLPGPNETAHNMIEGGSLCFTAAAGAYTTAGEEARSTRLPGPHNGPQDAVRHCIWMCKIARVAGASCARTIGSNHEVAGQDRGDPLDESEMDHANNEQGINCASVASKDNCKTRCMNKFLSCRLSGLGGRKTCFP